MPSVTMGRRRDIPEERLEAALAELAHAAPRLPDAALAEMVAVATSGGVATAPPRASWRRRVGLPAVAAAAVAATALAAFPAWLVFGGDGPAGVTGTARAGAGTWGSSEAVPGRPVAADRVLGVAMRESGVLPARLGQVLAHGSGEEKIALVAAADAGRVCYAVRAERFVGDFLCPRRLDSEVLIQFSVAAAGSPRGLRVVGVARSDVTRVVLELSDGTRHALRLNRWHAFAYSAPSHPGSVRFLTAYGPGETPLARIAFRGSTWVRLCGATTDPCGVRPDTPVEPGLVL